MGHATHTHSHPPSAIQSRSSEKVGHSTSFFLAFRRKFSVPRLNPILLHGEGAINIVQLVVESTGVTHGLTIGVPSPECGGCGLAVGTAGTLSPSGRQSSLRFDERPVLSIHLVVETTGVTEVVTVTITSPQRSGRGSTVYTFTSLRSGL